MKTFFDVVGSLVAIFVGTRLDMQPLEAKPKEILSCRLKTDGDCWLATWEELERNLRVKKLLKILNSHPSFVAGCFLKHIISAELSNIFVKEKELPLGVLALLTLW